MYKEKTMKVKKIIDQLPKFNDDAELYQVIVEQGGGTKYIFSPRDVEFMGNKGEFSIVIHL